MASEADDLINGAYPEGSRSAASVLDAYRDPMLERVRNTAPGPSLPPLPSRSELRSYDRGASRDPLATRPKDWAETSGVGTNAGFSPALAGADIGTMIGVGARNLANHNWSGFLDEAPSYLSVFLGPRGASRLAETRGANGQPIRHGSDWGGLDRLKWAQEQNGWMRPGSPEHAEIWRQSGWTPAGTWGGKIGPNDQPATVLATPHFAIDESQLHPMRSGKQTIWQGDGGFGQLTHGWDQVLAAEPALAKMRTKLTLDPEMRAPDGATNFEFSYPPGKTRGPIIGTEPRSLEARAYDMPTLAEVLRHEGQHVFSTNQFMPWLGENPYLNPIKGTEAERLIARRRQLAESALKRAEDPGSRVSDDQFSRLFERQHMYRRLEEKFPGFAAYMDSKPERASREEQVRGLLPAEQQIPLVPGSVDTYREGLLGKNFEKLHSVPLEAFDPKRMR